MESKFTHLNTEGDPTMVDISDKSVTKRMAQARAIMHLPDDIISAFTSSDIQSKKGPVFQTAIIAGIMGAKKTSELIPLCHPLALDKCQVDIHINDRNEVVIDCIAKITSKTGVEMEALTGASVAALTIYDMCKGISHGMIIKEIKLIKKSGGKSDINLHG